MNERIAWYHHTRNGFMKTVVLGVAWQGSRRVLALGAGTVLIIAGMAGFVSSEFTLTLAVGAFGATLTGVAWLLFRHRAVKVSVRLATHQSNAGTAPTSTDSVENLPDPWPVAWTCHCDQNKRTVSRLLGAKVRQL